MKILKDIIYGIDLDSIKGDTNLIIKSIEFDSRKVAQGSLFVAIKGENVDGHAFIDKAIKNGASAIIYNDYRFGDEKITTIKTPNTRKSLSIVASNFYDNPSKKIKLVGVTGTNGKTTVATILFNLFNKAGLNSGLISTINIEYAGNVIENHHTTPDSKTINEVLNEMLLNKIEFCFMEVSSHGIDQDRINGLKFYCGVFTNITRDHLDYHKSFASYRNVKKKFFDNLKRDSFAIINADDKNSKFMVQNCLSKVKTFGIKNFADNMAKILEIDFSGMLLKINSKEFWTPLVGKFNASNLLAVFSVANIAGIKSIEILRILSQTERIKGRFEILKAPNNAFVIIDYAHTPNSLKNVIDTISQIRTKNELFTTIIGCGGNRDLGKRSKMGEIVLNGSDKVIFTSDNPRYEKPEKIINDMLLGVDPNNKKKISKIINRREAIESGCSQLNSGDILLVVGKGHETYQEIQGEKIPFDDVKIVKESFS
ncbi:MAG: UDP-N-acetylmuramoyl-L-alanyl-D-glutamate--2,6-diaminopimelate ligase [Flavobacteriaceae bacterium]|nr:UDP-N-acetylmuramoyl-L-alanyl-D-glutamate--2,6-diaminopimelate ligase [Flavobacteriaceae bacterium]|tara:strand:+ start:3783 stop:5231 length:1449 start_codon:yes stop_codon:yes gene_type:complete